MPVREDLKAIYSEAIKAVNPENATKNHLIRDNNKLKLTSSGKTIKELNLDVFDNIFVVGAGKATAPMAKAIEDILGDLITSGCISVKYGHTEKLSRIETIEASHPIPDEQGVKGASKIKSILEKAGGNDLVISLISGGGSALLPLPPETISLEEKRSTTDILLKSGATIHEINSVRKHLSLVKGGGMARAAYPATVINLMISDVVGDQMDVIASGPFVPDQSTFTMAMDTIKKYNMTETAPQAVVEYIQQGYEKEKKGESLQKAETFEKVTNLIIASNILALEAAKQEAIKRGYNSLILSSLIEGDTRETAFWHARIGQEILETGNPLQTPACIISGGETTVQVHGDGLGGRNTEFAMQAATFIQGKKRITMASVGTDGNDGPTDAAGAVSDGNTIEKAEKKEININKYIQNNDSYHFFELIGDLIKTGPTKTNVMDIRILLVE